MATIIRAISPLLSSPMDMDICVMDEKQKAEKKTKNTSTFLLRRVEDLRLGRNGVASDSPWVSLEEVALLPVSKSKAGRRNFM